MTTWVEMQTCLSFEEAVPSIKQGNQLEFVIALLLIMLSLHYLFFPCSSQFIKGLVLQIGPSVVTVWSSAGLAAEAAWCTAFLSQ